MDDTFVEQSDEFRAWLSRLKDVTAKAAIQIRINRLHLGNFGDSASVGNGVSELRVDVGKGYRVYYSKIGLKIVLLLVGGDKSSQSRDIKKARELNNKFRAAIEDDSGGEEHG